MKRLVDNFSGDYRILRIIFASNDPIETLHNLKTGKYSYLTFKDMYEYLEVKETLEEEDAKKKALQRKNN